MKHPRAADLTRLVRAVEAAGKSVAAVEVEWREIDGREVPVWTILTSGEPAEPVAGDVKW